jgi:predicted DNA-binding transcriptional regulator YafY
MRADRLLLILLTLQVQRRITARELAQQLEVSARTIHRDMEALCAAGVPLLAERGANGGWVLEASYQTNLTGLSSNEIQALFLNNPSKQLSDLGLFKSLEAARTKLLAALPAMHQRDAAFARERIYVDGAPWTRSTRPQEDISNLPTLQEAIWAERQVRMTYESGDGQVAERVLHPLGLVVKSGIWYLVALREGELRTYRISRIKAATITDQPATRPIGFDLAEYWQQSVKAMTADIPRTPFGVRVRADSAQGLHSAGRWVRVTHIAPADKEGWACAELTYESLPEACAFVLSFGPRIEVLEPDELRAAVAQMARDVVDIYNS